MKTMLKSLLFLLMAAAQLAVPGSMIYGREMTLAHGKQFLFRCAPVDPYDAFRGRYVRISVENQTASRIGEPLYRGQPVYVSLKVDEEGFATFDRVYLNPPESGDYLKTQVQYPTGNSKIRIRIPFDRYYMNEYVAPEAERAYRHERGESYVAVRVRNGNAVLEELYLKGKPIREYLNSQESQFSG